MDLYTITQTNTKPCVFFGHGTGGGGGISRILGVGWFNFNFNFLIRSWNLLIDGFGCPKHSLISYLRDQSMQSSWCNRSWALVLFAYALLAPSIYLWSFLWKFQNRAHILLGNEWQRKYILLNNPTKPSSLTSWLVCWAADVMATDGLVEIFQPSHQRQQPSLLLAKFSWCQNSPAGKILATFLATTFQIGKMFCHTQRLLASKKEMGVRTQNSATCGIHFPLVTCLQYSSWPQSFFGELPLINPNKSHFS